MVPVAIQLFLIPPIHSPEILISQWNIRLHEKTTQNPDGGWLMVKPIKTRSRSRPLDARRNGERVVFISSFA